MTAAGRPFLYFPLRNYFEQNSLATPEVIAAAIAEEIHREVDYVPG